jgi:ABC-type lipoprotein release transport system permease subunit
MGLYGAGLVLSALSPLPALAALIGCVAAGVGLSVIAAIYPARVAARMLPANALRSTI